MKQSTNHYLREKHTALVLCVLIISILMSAPGYANSDVSPKIKRKALSIAERVYTQLEIKWNYQAKEIAKFSEQISDMTGAVPMSPYDLLSIQSSMQQQADEIKNRTHCEYSWDKLSLCDIDWPHSARRQQQLAELKRTINGYKAKYETNPNLTDSQVIAAFEESREAILTLRNDLTDDLDTMSGLITETQTRAARKMHYVRMFLAADDLT